MQFDGRGSKIMVVDHDRTTLEMVQIRLDVAGFQAVAVATAALLLATIPGVALTVRPSAPPRPVTPSMLSKHPPAVPAMRGFAPAESSL